MSMAPLQLNGSQYIKPRKSSGIDATLAVAEGTSDGGECFRAAETVCLTGRICGGATAFRGMTAAAVKDGGREDGSAMVLVGFLAG